MNDYGNALSPAKDFSKADALLVRSLEILLNRASSESLDSLFVVVLPWFGPILVPSLLQSESVRNCSKEGDFLTTLILKGK